jgi:opacity protein-like surface antigen
MRRLLVVATALTTLLLAGYSDSLDAQDGFRLKEPILQLTVRGGANQHLGRGALFDDFRSIFTLERDDFRAMAMSGDLAVLLGSRLDVALSVSTTATESPSEYREWEGSDGEPIRQQTNLRIIPVALAARYRPLDRGRLIGSYAWVPATWSPYLLAGAGITWFSLSQTGEFVDVEDLSIFPATMDTQGTTTGVHLGAGLDRWFTPTVGLNAEVRYSWGSGRGTNTFRLQDVDLSGVQFGIGLALRL